MKTIGTMLCLASLLLLAACTAGPEEAAGTQDTTLPGAAVATCRVVDVQDDQLILAAADGGENDVYALALGDLPVTYEDPSQTEIVPGNQIQIGYGGTVLSESLVKCMMENVGADASDVNMINVGFELMSSMTTGNVDATIGCLVNHEVPQLEEEGFDVNYFSVSGYGIPNYYEEVFLTNDDLLENEPEVVAGFLRAAKKGFDDFKADPDGCLAILMNNQNEENFPLTQSVEEQSCATLIPLMETEDAAFLTQTDECWQENIDWMLENQLIDKAVDVSDVMTIVDFEN